MSSVLLTPEERQEIENLLANNLSAPWQRRARILLFYDDGLPTIVVSRQTPTSPSWARHWKRQYQRCGLDIFPASLRTAAQEALTQVQAQVPPPGSESAQIAVQPSPLHPDFELYRITRPTSPGLLPADTLAEAGRKIFRFQFSEVLRHEEGTRLGEDIEELHDMRVATRRLRAAFEIFEAAFKPKVLKNHLRGLRSTGRTLGRVRDLDVFMEKAQRYLESLPEEQRQGLDPLTSAWQAQREAGRTQMATFLDSSAYQKFKLRFSRFIMAADAHIAQPEAETPPPPTRVCEIAPILVYSRLASVRAFAALLDQASIEQLHLLRIEFKKFRYTLEFFREVLGDDCKGLINEIKTLQDHLGDLNDAQVAIGLLSQFLLEWDRQQATRALGERQSPEPIVAYLAYQHAERHRLMTTFHDAWANFERPEFRQRLAQAVAAL